MITEAYAASSSFQEFQRLAANVLTKEQQTYIRSKVQRKPGEAPTNLPSEMGGLGGLEEGVEPRIWVAYNLMKNEAGKAVSFPDIDKCIDALGSTFQ